jgi:hypothetical protein
VARLQEALTEISFYDPGKVYPSEAANMALDMSRIASEALK